MSTLTSVIAATLALTATAAGGAVTLDAGLLAASAAQEQFLTAVSHNVELTVLMDQASVEQPTEYQRGDAVVTGSYLERAVWQGDIKPGLGSLELLSPTTARLVWEEGCLQLELWTPTPGEPGAGPGAVSSRIVECSLAP